MPEARVLAFHVLAKASVSLRLLNATKDLLPWLRGASGVSDDRCVATNATDFELEIEDGGHQTTRLGEERGQETTTGDDSFCRKYQRSQIWKFDSNSDAQISASSPSQSEFQLLPPLRRSAGGGQPCLEFQEVVWGHTCMRIFGLE